MQYQQQIVHLGHLCMVRGAALACGWHLIENASTDGGGTGRRMAEGWRVKWLREAEIFVYPTKISVSRNCVFYLPQQVFR